MGDVATIATALNELSNEVRISALSSTIPIYDGTQDMCMPFIRSINTIYSVLKDEHATVRTALQRSSGFVSQYISI